MTFQQFKQSRVELSPQQVSERPDLNHISELDWDYEGENPVVGFLVYEDGNYITRYADDSYILFLEQFEYSTDDGEDVADLEARLFEWVVEMNAD